MMWVDYHFQLDFNSSYCPKVAVMKQNNRFLSRFVIRPTINGSSIDLTNLYARLVAKKPDNTQCLLDGIPQDGKLVFHLEDQVATATGIVQFEVILSENVTDGRHTSATFFAEVVQGVFNESALESHDSYPALLNALDAAQEVRSTPQTIDMGGTGAVTATDALVNLGAQPKIADTGWVELALLDGIVSASCGGRSTPCYRKIGNHVFIEGGVTITPSGETFAFATLPDGYRPSSVIHVLQSVSGKRIARINVDTAGNMKLEWVVNLSDGSNSTTKTWMSVKMDYFVDE